MICSTFLLFFFPPLHPTYQFYFSSFLLFPFDEFCPTPFSFCPFFSCELGLFTERSWLRGLITDNTFDYFPSSFPSPFTLSFLFFLKLALVVDYFFGLISMWSNSPLKLDRLDITFTCSCRRLVFCWHTDSSIPEVSEKFNILLSFEAWLESKKSLAVSF